MQPIGLTDSNWGIWQVMMTLRNECLVDHPGMSDFRLDRLEGFYEGVRINVQARPEPTF